MSGPVLDLNGIKMLFGKGLQYARNIFPSGLYSVNNQICDYQQSLVNNASDLSTVMNAISMPNPVLRSAFKGPKKICAGCELQYTGIQFGVANTGWYFTYGIAGNIAFVLSFGRTEIAPPKIVEDANIPPSEAVRWGIGGGFGIVGGDFYNIPNESMYLSYTQPSYSTFILSGKGNKIKSANFQTTTPMQFTMSVDFLDSTGKEHTINVQMIANTPPSPNVPNSCGGCSNGMGSLYYSYTDMNVIVNADGGQAQTGKGWIDHQLFKTGIPKNIYAQAQMSVLNMIAKPKSGGWLWFAIQDYESGIQYMLTHFFGTKFFQDDISLNKNIPMQLINVYKKGIAYFKPTSTDMDSADLQVVMVSTVNVNGLNLPSKYNITLPGGKKVVLALSTGPNVYPSAYGSYENASLLYNESGNVIGLGIIEANGYFTNDQYAARYIISAGGNSTDSNALSIVSKAVSPNYPQSTLQKFFSIIILLFPIWIGLFILFFVTYKKENRQNRLMLMTAIVLLSYISYKKMYTENN